jgi:hypothetical protein
VGLPAIDPLAQGEHDRSRALEPSNAALSRIGVRQPPLEFEDRIYQPDRLGHDAGIQITRFNELPPRVRPTSGVEHSVDGDHPFITAVPVGSQYAPGAGEEAAGSVTRTALA